MVDLARLDRARVRDGGMRVLTRLLWPHVPPTEPYVHNWHIDAICDHLVAQSRFELTDLVINVPPATGKSLLVNVVWPLWTWIDPHPEARFLFGSHDQSLVGKRDGGRILGVLRSEWWIARWGRLLPSGAAAASDFTLSTGGSRLATSVGGKGVGHHAHHRAADDPVKPQDAARKLAVALEAMRRVESWWSGTFGGRAADPKRFTSTVVQQRLHRGDLAGVCAEQGYTLLSLPMRASERPCRTFWFADPRQPGELLHPARIPEDAVQRIERRLGPRASAAQLDQRPDVEGGTVFKASWFRFWSDVEGEHEPCMCDDCLRAGESQHDTGRPCSALPESGFDFQSWDLAFKGSTDSDPVAGQRWRLYSPDLFLLAFVTQRMDIVETLACMRTFGEPFETRCVEDAANGAAVEALLRAEFEIEMRTTGGGKEGRANAVAPVVAERRVHLPAHAPGLYALVASLAAFPFAVHDDDVDAFTHAVVYAREQEGADMSAWYAKRKASRTSSKTDKVR